MPTSRFVVVSFTLWLWYGLEAFGGAPALEETCRDRENLQVITRYESSRRPFAVAVQLPPKEVRKGESPYVIYVNSEIYFLGWETQQWLYLRQCAYIFHGRLAGEEGVRDVDIRDEENADCWAVRKMSQTKSFSSRTLYAIERDIERVIIKEQRWPQVLPGPERRISLSMCLK